MHGEKVQLWLGADRKRRHYSYVQYHKWTNAKNISEYSVGEFFALAMVKDCLQ